MELGIGGRIREARERLDLRLKDVVDRLTEQGFAISIGALSNYEGDARQVPYDLLALLAHHWDEAGNFQPGILEVSINYLLNLPESAGAMNARELNLIYNYRRIPDTLKPAIDTMVAQAARIAGEAD
jgi:transcriptional regulator with XRE-family HTH domain